MPEPAADAIAVVVVSYQSVSTIEDCLQCLRASEAVAQVRVVDNGSDDGTLAIIQRHAAADPRVRFIGNPDNPGFAVACNQGARDSSAAWLAFVNPDGMPEPDALARLLAHARRVHGDVLLGTDLVDEHGVRDPAARRRDPDFARMLRSRDARDLSIPRDASQALQPVQAISGAVMLMQRSLFERIGGFDEGYRLHAEDLDLCRRARMAGALVAVANDIVVLHLRGVSSRSRPVFVEWHKHRGLWRYFSRFEGPGVGRVTRLGVWLAIWLRFPLAVVRHCIRT